MADYVAREWSGGDIVTAANLNRIENGIEDAGSGQILVVTDTNGTLDKTWQEIYDAFPNVYIVGERNKKVIQDIGVSIDGTNYYIQCLSGSYEIDSSSGYPGPQAIL